MNSKNMSFAYYIIYENFFKGNNFIQITYWNDYEKKVESVLNNTTSMYSGVPNNYAGWNKSAG